MADKLILTMYGEAYETSITPLRILMVGLVVIFLNFPVGAFLNACNRQIKNTINMAIAVGINIILNIYFIAVKGYTFNGAAVAAMVSGFVLFFLGLRWVRKIIKIDKKILLISLLKTFAAGAVMAALLLLLKDQLSIFIIIPLAALFYLGVLYSLKGISKSDIRSLYRAFLRKSL